MPSQDAKIHYPVEDGVSLIEIRLNTVNQLFNSLDPSPFHEKDLDADAEDYIVSAADDLPISAPLKLVFLLPGEEFRSAGAEALAEAIHHYFGYALAATRRKLRFSFREGRISLLLGLAFLVVCVTLRQLTLTLGDDPINQIVAEGLLISGWVAMWRPLHIFLYGWWPLRHLCQVYAKLGEIPVEVRSAAAPPAAVRSTAA